jgi:RNA polymerase sigma-54 factor
VDGKYVSTPHGVFPLRYFFSAGFTGSDGQDISANAVKQLIKEYIADEDSSSPLSDEKLAGLLKQAGLSVARRTVAKYREAMKIPAASLRKKY